jgi:hypothetical protein
MLQQSPKPDCSHVYPVVPPKVPSGEISKPVAVDVAAEVEVVEVVVLLVDDFVLDAETMVEVDPAAA